MSDAITQLAVHLLDAVQTFFHRSPWLILRDCIDIGIVATLIYWVLAVLRGTRAMQMAVGLILLSLGYALARQLGLVTTWTILNSMLTYIVLIVVVIFQNDIRRALMRVGAGGTPFLRATRTARETLVIEEVIKAVQLLAQKRVGALIVFERGATLDEFIEHGTVIDAAITKELLYSIFIPSFENPLHDGAVIVRDWRAWQAGSFLPLASSDKLDRNLGTRHRAALGITGESDAVSVVVSEERGEISLCFEGNIVRNLDGESLRNALFGLFYRKAGSPAEGRAKKTKDKARASTAPVSCRP